MKRTISIILSLMMIIGLFTAVPVTANAAETEDESIGASYDLRLGETQVTDANKNDILGDGGSLYAEGGSEGINKPDDLIIAEPVTRVEAIGVSSAISFGNSFYSYACVMTVPEDGVITDTGFYESDGTTVANHVVFEKMKEISSVSVNITAPAADGKLPFDADVPENAGYKVETQYYTNGVNRYDEDGIWLDPDEVATNIILKPARSIPSRCCWSTLPTFTDLLTKINYLPRSTEKKRA